MNATLYLLGYYYTEQSNRNVFEVVFNFLATKIDSTRFVNILHQARREIGSGHALYLCRLSFVKLSKH